MLLLILCLRPSVLSAADLGPESLERDSDMTRQVQSVISIQGSAWTPSLRGRKTTSPAEAKRNLIEEQSVRQTLGGSIQLMKRIREGEIAEED